MRKLLISLLSITAFALGWFLSAMTSRIPKDVLTISHITRLKYALCEYGCETGSFPDTLEAIVAAGKVEQDIIMDGWGKHFKSEVLDGDAVCISSMCGASESLIHDNIQHIITTRISRSEWVDEAVIAE